MVQSHWFCLFQVCLNFWIHVMFLIYLLTYLSIYFLIGVHVRMLCLVSPGLLSFLSYLFSIFRSLLTSVNKEARTVGLSTFVLWDLHYRTSFKLWIEQLFFSELCRAGHIQFGLIMFLWNSESSELRCPIESLAFEVFQSWVSSLWATISSPTVTTQIHHVWLQSHYNILRLKVTKFKGSAKWP